MTKQNQGKVPRGILHLSDTGLPLGEDGAVLDPPLLLITEIAARNLLGVKERRLLEMIDQGVLLAQKATAEQQVALIRSGRIQGKHITFKGIYLVEPASLTYADARRRRVGYPAGKKRSEREKMTGVTGTRR